MKYKKYLWIVLCLILTAWPAPATEYETRVSGLDSSSGEAFTTEVKSVFHKIRHSYDLKMKNAASQRIFALTASRANEKAHMYSLAYRGMFSEPVRVNDLRRVITLADQYDENELAGEMYDAISAFHLEGAQYDSAMFYLLKSAAMYRQIDNANFENIQHRIGDLFYRARIDDRAQHVYQSILDKYDTPEKWNFWRPYVLLNNLGQIALRAKDYDLANRYFTRSRNNQKQYLHGLLIYDYLTTVNLRLAETRYRMGRHSEAHMFLSEAASCAVDSISDYVKVELFYWKSFFARRQNQYRETVHYLNRLFELKGKPRVSPHLLVDAHKLAAEIHSETGDSLSAIRNLNKSISLSDSLQGVSNLARAMLQLARDGNNGEIAALPDLKVGQDSLSFFLYAFLAASISILLIIGTRSRFKKSKLRGSDAEHHHRHPLSPEESKQMKELVRRFEALCRTEKIYLDKNLTIQKAAEALSSNRTYLSRSINSILKVSFSNYINALRVEEALKMISIGEAKRYTLDAIAGSCGFSNRNAFRNAFKQHTGIAPSSYIKNQKLKPSEISNP